MASNHVSSEAHGAQNQSRGRYRRTDKGTPEPRPLRGVAQDSFGRIAAGRKSSQRPQGLSTSPAQRFVTEFVIGTVVTSCSQEFGGYVETSRNGSIRSGHYGFGVRWP
jgi:hypothetical protein